eukprot:TRINITY_DN4553_c0_g1_i2.p1 TRINITY_DN4553_c0_g1~~TRINITY_DN4553_c0_g1_i2.p1  ORF type:complete len:129 (-),score=37.93 TRINITY_DN4553_c0_g1_i2:157-543(-)
MTQQLVTFDSHYEIRVLEQEKYEEALKLKDNCKSFVEKTEKFTGIVNSFMEVVDSKGAVIEIEKLRAIGLRNQVESEADLRKRKQRELEALINEKKAELDRYMKQLDSISRVEQEQKILLEKLSNNEL